MRVDTDPSSDDLVVYLMDSMGHTVGHLDFHIDTRPAISDGASPLKPLSFVPSMQPAAEPQHDCQPLLCFLAASDSPAPVLCQAALPSQVPPCSAV